VLVRDLPACPSCISHCSGWIRKGGVECVGMGICERSRDGDGLTCAGDGCQDGEEEERKVYSRHGDAVCAADAVRRWLEDEHGARPSKVMDR
jgi:hypothetical protein